MINARKATYTIYNLATKEERAYLQVDRHVLSHGTTPIFLGISFDSRMTWKQTSDKCNATDRIRTAVIKKSWNNLGSS